MRNFLCENSYHTKKHSQCLKITQNVALQFFLFWHFPPIFVQLKLTCLVTLFDCKLQVFKNSSKWTIFGISDFVSSKRKLSSCNETFTVIFKHCASTKKRLITLATSNGLLMNMMIKYLEV